MVSNPYPFLIFLIFSYSLFLFECSSVSLTFFPSFLPLFNSVSVSLYVSLILPYSSTSTSYSTLTCHCSLSLCFIPQDGRTDGQTPPSLLNHSLLALHSIFQPLSPPKQHTPHDCNTKKWKPNASMFNAIERSLVQLSHTRTSVCEGIMSCHQLSLSILCSNSKAQ